MNIVALIEELEQQRDIHGEDLEVRYASQPSWPFENAISDTVIAVTHSIKRERAIGEVMAGEAGGFGEGKEMSYAEAAKVVDTEMSFEDADGTTKNVLYLVEDHHIGYLPGDAKEEIGW